MRNLPIDIQRKIFSQVIVLHFNDVLTELLNKTIKCELYAITKKYDDSIKTYNWKKDPIYVQDIDVKDIFNQHKWKKYKVLDFFIKVKGYCAFAKDCIENLRNLEYSTLGLKEDLSILIQMCISNEQNSKEIFAPALYWRSIDIIDELISEGVERLA